MRYLWEVPHALDGAALRAFVGDLPGTPLTEALRNTFAVLGIGCAPASPVEIRKASLRRNSFFEQR